MTPVQPDSLLFEAHVPPQVREGMPVRVALRLTNVGDKPLELHLQGRTIAFDITIRDADGSVVWRRLEGETIQAILRIEMLAPGQVLELEDTWDQRTRRGEQVGPGLYSVAGRLPTDSPQPLSTPPVALRIVPR